MHKQLLEIWIQNNISSRFLYKQMTETLLLLLTFNPLLFQGPTFLIVLVQPNQYCILLLVMVRGSYLIIMYNQFKNKILYDPHISYPIKRNSLSTPKTHKQTPSKTKIFQIDGFLNCSIKPKTKKCHLLSTSAELDPENQLSTPYKLLTHSRKQRPQYKVKEQKCKKKGKPTPKQQIEKILKQDVKLRIFESIQISQWIQLLMQYRNTVPEKCDEVSIVIRELEKIVELKEKLQLSKYNLISKVL